MPTLEDTIEFQASTLNDLLEADAKAVALPSEGEGKYRSWAYLSTAAAGLLAILLVVALVTDSGGGGGDESTAKSVKQYPGKIHKTLKLAGQPSSDIRVDGEVSVYKAGELVAAPLFVTQIIAPKAGTPTAYGVELAMTPEQAALFNKAFGNNEKGQVEAYVPGQPTAPPASAPAPSTESTTPTTQTPPATTTPESTPPATG
jgi:hypothetical protein